MKKLRNNHETLCYFVLKPLLNICLRRMGFHSLSWHYLRNKLQRKTCRVAPFPLDDIIGRVCFDFRLAFPPGDIALDKLVCFDLRPLSRDRDRGRRRWGIRRPRAGRRASQPRRWQQRSSQGSCQNGNSNFWTSCNKRSHAKFSNPKEDGRNFYQKYCAHTEKMI